MSGLCPHHNLRRNIGWRCGGNIGTSVKVDNRSILQCKSPMWFTQMNGKRGNTWRGKKAARVSIKMVPHPIGQIFRRVPIYGHLHESLQSDKCSLLR